MGIIVTEKKIKTSNLILADAEKKFALVKAKGVPAALEASTVKIADAKEKLKSEEAALKQLSSSLIASEKARVSSEDAFKAAQKVEAKAKSLLDEAEANLVKAKK